MGLTKVNMIVKPAREHKKQIKIDFLMDSGAIYSLVSSSELDKIGIKPYKTVSFVLADGTKIERKVGDAYFEYMGEGGAAPVIFGEEGDEPLLGAITLESMGLILNPFRRELIPMRMLLA